MRTLWGSLIRPHQDYVSQLWAPVGSLPELRDQEAPLRAYTKRFRGFHNLHYWDRLALVGMSSTERRVERYKALYVWKIIQGLVPNCGLSWSIQGRRGLLVALPPLAGSRMAVRTLREKSFFTEAPRIFNSLPSEIRGHSGSLASFKARLDAILSSVPDLPVSDTRPSFATDRHGWPSNSLPDCFRALASDTLPKRMHEAVHGTGTRLDLVTRLATTHPGLGVTW